MNPAISIGQHAQRHALSALERAVVGILVAMAAIWTAFQALEIQAVFPPIGILYAVGSIAIAAAIVLGRRQKGPVVAAGWGLLMMVPESLPAIDHLTDWSELSTHFAHYLIIVTFFPLAVALVATGIGAYRQNTGRTTDHRAAPDWLRTAAIGLVALIVVANAVVVTLYALDLP